MKEDKQDRRAWDGAILEVIPPRVSHLNPDPSWVPERRDLPVWLARDKKEAGVDFAILKAYKLWPPKTDARYRNFLKET